MATKISAALKMQIFTQDCSYCFQITRYVPSMFMDIAFTRIKKNHNVGIESKAVLENTFLMAYTEMIICCFYKLKLCQSIIF